MIVLDTHILIWMLQADPRLGPGSREAITTAAAANGVLVPAICIWETELLVRRNKVALPFETGIWVRKAFSETGLRLAPLEPEIAIETVRLDWDHKDPADRMIVATARIRQARLITVDRAILAYGATGGCTVVDAGQ